MDYVFILHETPHELRSQLFCSRMSELVQTAHLAGSLDRDTDSGASNADSLTAPAAN